MVKRLPRVVPPVYKEAEMGIFLEEFNRSRAVGSIALNRTGISWRTVRDWRDRFPVFKKEYNKIVARYSSEVMDVLYKHGIEGQQQVDGTNKIEPRFTEMLAEMKVKEYRDLKGSRSWTT